MPVSSSKVTKRTPLALPGRWRTSTRPAASSQRPSRAPMASAQVTVRHAARSTRRNATGCRRSVRPTWPQSSTTSLPAGHRPERDDGFVYLGHEFGLARRDGGAQGESARPAEPRSAIALLAARAAEPAGRRRPRQAERARQRARPPAATDRRLRRRPGRLDCAGPPAIDVAANFV